MREVLRRGDLHLQQRPDRRLPSPDVLADLQRLLTRGAKLEQDRVGLRRHCLKTGVELIAQLANPPDCSYLVFLQQLLGQLRKHLEIARKDRLHFIQRILHPQAIVDKPHRHQAKQNPADTVSGNGERSLDGELLQINQVKGQGKLHPKIGKPCRRGRNPGGDGGDEHKQESEAGNRVEVWQHKNLRSHAKDKAANDRPSEPQELLLPR